jgi:hypothetical protein
MTTPIAGVLYRWDGADWGAHGRNVPVPPETFTLGTTKPDASNTGVPSNVSLVPRYQNFTITTPGTILDGLDIYGWVNVQAANVTIQNCRIRGAQSTPYSNGGNVILAQSTGLVLDRCTIRPDYPTWWLEGIYGGGYTLNRCDISGVVDGALVRSGSTTFTGNYFHDFFFSDQSGDQAGSMPPSWTHNDGIQFRVASGSGPHTVRGNNFQWYPDEAVPNGLSRNAVLETGYASGPAYYNKSMRSPYSGRFLWGAAVTASPDLGPITGCTVTENWFEGGTACFQMSSVNPAGSAMNFGTVSLNRFGRDQFNYGSESRYQIRYKSTAVIAGLTTNYWDSVGSVDPSRWGQAFAVGFTSGIRLD